MEVFVYNKSDTDKCKRVVVYNDGNAHDELRLVDTYNDGTCIVISDLSDDYCGINYMVYSDELVNSTIVYYRYNKKYMFSIRVRIESGRGKIFSLYLYDEEVYTGVYMPSMCLFVASLSTGLHILANSDLIYKVDEDSVRYAESCNTREQAKKYLKG